MAFANTRDTASYNDAKEILKKDPVGCMKQAADEGMTLSQLANGVSPGTIAEQKRNILSRVAQDEGLSFVESEVSMPSPVEDFTRSELGHAVMYDYLHGISMKPYRAFTKQRASLLMPNEQPPNSPTNAEVLGKVSVDTPVGMTLNPAELVADSHSIKASSYKPFKWVYDKEKIGRSKVNPGTPLPTSTLGQKDYSLEMAKWGNRFRIPYEVLRVEEVRINKVASMIMLESITEEVRLFDELVGILELGDGSTGSAATSHHQAAFTGKSGTAGELNIYALGNFIDEAFTAPHYCSHLILRKDAVRDIKEQMGDDSGQILFTQLASMGLFPRLNSMDPTVGAVRFGKSEQVSANKLIGLDSRFAVELVSQTGADIREQAKIIQDQTEDMTISNTYLWSKIQFGAVQVLDYSQAP